MPATRIRAGEREQDPRAASRTRPPEAPTFEARTREQIDAFNGDPNFMTSLARGLAVIGGFTQEQRRLSIAQLSHKTGLSRAAVRRVLYTLSRLGYVASDDGRRYALQPRLLSLGHAYLSSTPLVAAVQPYLDRVSEAVGESCSLAALEGEDILYLARSVTSRIISITLNVGSRLPAFCTSIGQVLLADLEPAALDAYFARLRIDPFTDQTPPSIAALRALIAQVRQRGYALAVEQKEMGVMSVGVPLRSVAGRTVAGINVIAQTGRESPDKLVARCLPHLRAAAASLSTQIAA